MEQKIRAQMCMVEYEHVRMAQSTCGRCKTQFKEGQPVLQQAVGGSIWFCVPCTTNFCAEQGWRLEIRTESEVLVQICQCGEIRGSVIDGGFVRGNLQWFCSKKCASDSCPDKEYTPMSATLAMVGSMIRQGVV